MTLRTTTIVSVGIVTGALVLWVGVIGPPVLADPGMLATHTVGGIHLHPASAYSLPWAVGVWVGGLAGVWVLRVRNALTLRAVAAMGLGTVAFIAGTKLHFRLESMPVVEAARMSLGDVASPGVRLPIGIWAGALVAMAVAASLRAGWRQVGDAWAVAMSVAIPIGRVACLLAGCCFGTICLHWPSAFCMTYGPSSPAFSRHVTEGLLDAGSLASLPVHPLPIYFALASLATLGVLVYMLRHGSDPGMPLAAFAVLRSAAKLLLEQLRADARPGMLMTVIPAVALAGGLIVFAVRAFRVRRGAEPMRHAQTG